MTPSPPLFFDLSNHGKVELSGPDARMFLHNLCTNDVKNLPVGGGCEAFLTTAKAKVVAHILVSRMGGPGGDVLLLDSAPGTSEKVMQHLNHFLISEQVELVDRTSELALLRVTDVGQTILSAINLSKEELPHLHHRAAVIAGVPVNVRQHRLLVAPAIDVFCPAHLVETVRQALLAAGAKCGDPNAYETLRIEAGLPEFGRDIDENRMVVEVGRIKEAICYTKGCFLGQEPIVMARDRGHVNRTLLGLKIVGSEPVSSGAKVLRGDEEAGQTTSSIWSPRCQSVIALAYMKRGHQEPGTEVFVEGRAAKVSRLPFAE